MGGAARGGPSARPGTARPSPARRFAQLRLARGAWRQIRSTLGEREARNRAGTRGRVVRYRPQPPGGREHKNVVRPPVTHTACRSATERAVLAGPWGHPRVTPCPGPRVAWPEPPPRARWSQGPASRVAGSVPTRLDARCGLRDPLSRLKWKRARGRCRDRGASDRRGSPISSTWGRRRLASARSPRPRGDRERWLTGRPADPSFRGSSPSSGASGGRAPANAPRAARLSPSRRPANLRARLP